MLNNLFKYKGWTVKSAKIQDSSINVELVLDARYRFSCPKCHTRITSHSYRDVCIRDLPVLSRSVHISWQLMQGYCAVCKQYHTTRHEHIHPSMGFSWRLMRLISDLYRFVPSCRLSIMFGISASSIRRIDREVLAKCLPPVDLNHIRAILIDEKYLGRCHGFVTLVINAHTCEPLYMAQGKSQESLDGFFSSMSEAQKAAIEVVGIDRSNAYRAAVAHYLPRAAICFDHFHVISNLNDALDQVRRQEMHCSSSTSGGLVSNSRFLLLRGGEKLKKNARLRLERLLMANKNICDAYVLKEQFREMYRAKHETSATWRLIEWLRMVRASSLEPLKRFARNLSKSFNEVINFFRYRISSGKIEAINASISRIQAKACGLFDIPYLFLKLRQAFHQRI